MWMPLRKLRLASWARGAAGSLLAIALFTAGCGGTQITSSGGGGATGSTSTGGAGGAAGSTATGGTGGSTATPGQVAARVRLIDSGESNPLLAKSDAFTSRLSPLDVAARLGDASKTLPADYLAFASAQARDFTAEERDSVAASLALLDDKLTAAGLKIPAAPTEILLAKSTGAEEGGADGYTREGTIVLSESAIGWGTAKRAGLIAHELFHVLTRANPKLAVDAHALLGFKPIPEVTLPPERDALRITNPDAPFIDREIHVTVAGADVACVPLLQGSSPYMGGAFFSYLGIYLYDPKQDAAYTFDQVSGYEEQIGTTTQYNFHPEEISAEHFRLGVWGANVNDPALVASLLALFK